MTARRRRRVFRDLGFGTVVADESRRRRGGRGRRRRFWELSLERNKVTFLPLAWTIVHPLDESSPLENLDREKCLATDAEFLILLTGIDETFSQRVHSRSSYKAEEVIWNARLEDIFHHPSDHERMSIDVSRLSDVRLPEAESG